MFIYVFSTVLIVASNILYNIAQKSTPSRANPFLALLITYLTAALLTFIAFNSEDPVTAIGTAMTEVGLKITEILHQILSLNPNAKIYLMGYYAPPTLKDRKDLIEKLNGVIGQSIQGVNGITICSDY